MLTRNDMLKFATNLMSYFDKIGGLGDPTEDNAILGAPVTMLDQWMTQGKETG